MKRKFKKKVTNNDNNIGDTSIPDGADSSSIKRLSTLEFIYAMFGLLLSIALIILGVTFLNKINQGEIEFLVKLLNLHVETKNASPGIILIISGLITLYITQYRIRK